MVDTRANHFKHRMPLITEWNDSDTLVIAATGYGKKLSLPVGQFFEAAGLEYASKIVITDPSMLKTLGGLPPELATFEEMLAHLQQLIASYPHKNLYFTGTSGGAHTALLLGHLLKADKVVVFAPYPYISEEELRRRNDPALVSMARVIEKFEVLPEHLKRYRDLGNVLVDWNGKTDYFVHVSRYNPLDFMRANYLRDMPHLKIVSHAFNEHGIASMLSKSSQLKQCFVFPYRRSWFTFFRLHLKYVLGRFQLRKKRSAAGS